MILHDMLGPCSGRVHLCDEHAPPTRLLGNHVPYPSIQRHQLHVHPRPPSRFFSRLDTSESRVRAEHTQSLYGDAHCYPHRIHRILQVHTPPDLEPRRIPRHPHTTPSLHLLPSLIPPASAPPLAACTAISPICPLWASRLPRRLRRGLVNLYSAYRLPSN